MIMGWEGAIIPLSILYIFFGICCLASTKESMSNETPKTCPCMGDVCWGPASYLVPLLLWPLVIVWALGKKLWESAKTSSTLCGIPLPAAWKKRWEVERALENGDYVGARRLLAQRVEEQRLVQEEREAERAREESVRVSRENARARSSEERLSTPGETSRGEDDDGVKIVARDSAVMEAGESAEGLDDDASEHEALLPHSPPPAYDA